MDYYADLRVAAGPTHAGFTAGVRKRFGGF